MNELELIKRVQNKDVNAFRELVHLYQQKVYTTSLYILGNPEDAQEATQDTFLKVYKYITNFKFNSKFSTWLYTISRNSCLDKVKKNPYVALEEHTLKKLKTEQDKPSEMLDFVSLLPENYKEMIILYFYTGFSYQEIADILNMSLSNVKTSMFRAKKMLREKIEKKQAAV